MTIKQDFKLKAQQNPDKFYPTKFLKQNNFIRNQCSICKTHFWSQNKDQKICGDSSCIGKYEFLEKPRFTSSPLPYTKVYQDFSKYFKSQKYIPINRYPVVARWRDDIEFTIASIADFQPYVVTGEISPPANPLVVPQTCLRFNDIDNVGITSRHFTSFVMIGQHAFLKSKNYKPNLYLQQIHNYLTKVLKIKPQYLTYHEDAWEGGGNLGPSMEFFVGGLELGNQVYMQYSLDENNQLKDLPIKVLDMGMGQERVTWLSQAKNTSYEAVFPKVLNYLKPHFNLQKDQILWDKFLPYSATLNLDEVNNIEEEWKKIAQKTNVGVENLKSQVYNHSKLFALADHTRTLLFALSDGALPSNKGGYYNLRILARRIFNIIKDTNIDLQKLFELHSQELSLQYPELKQNLEQIKKIMDAEKRKYLSSIQNIQQKLNSINLQSLKEEDYIRLYESSGITPDQIEQLSKQKNIQINPPKNFYNLLSQKQEAKKQQKHIISLPYKTKKLCYENIFQFKAKVLSIKDDSVILDKTAFYPQGGGQPADHGTINNIKVLDVKKYAQAIVHELEKKPNFKVGKQVYCEVDENTRLTLARHHTAIHLVGFIAKKLLGNHIWQKGSSLDEEKSRLDIQHYEQISKEQLREIELQANQMILSQHKVQVEILERTKAEQKYGFRVYQGGSVPEKYLRIQRIFDLDNKTVLDAQACSGTHLTNLSQLGVIKILGQSQIQDGIIRLEFCAGPPAIKKIQEQEQLLEDSSKILSVPSALLPKTVQRFFDEWKEQRKRLSTQQAKGPKLFRVILTVSDISKAQDFYEKLLGIKGERVSSGRHYFKLGETILACFDPKADGDNFAAKPNPDYIYFAVPNLEEIHKRALELNPMDTDKEINTQLWGERSFYMKDIFGNPICFVDEKTTFIGK